MPNLEEKTGDALMPRVPVAPYRVRTANAPRRKFVILANQDYAGQNQAIVADAPPPPSSPSSSSSVDASGKAGESSPVPMINQPDMSKLQLPDNFDALVGGEKIKAMEDVLDKIANERNRIVSEHEAVIKQLSDNIKEHKLEELRSSLNS